MTVSEKARRGVFLSTEPGLCFRERVKKIPKKRRMNAHGGHPELRPRNSVLSGIPQKHSVVCPAPFFDPTLCYSQQPKPLAKPAHLAWPCHATKTKRVEPEFSKMMKTALGKDKWINASKACRENRKEENMHHDKKKAFSLQRTVPCSSRKTFIASSSKSPGTKRARATGNGLFLPHTHTTSLNP